jgi:hypothetical protein
MTESSLGRRPLGRRLHHRVGSKWSSLSSLARRELRTYEGSNGL